MPLRAIKPRSERGSIKDIQNKKNESLEENPEMPPTGIELRIKSLYEHALVTKNQALIDSLGLIVMNGSPRDPVSVMRHREYIKEIGAKFNNQVKEVKEDFNTLIDESIEKPSEMGMVAFAQAGALSAILSESGSLIKNAATGVSRSVRAFWRTK